MKKYIIISIMFLLGSFLHADYMKLGSANYEYNNLEGEFEGLVSAVTNVKFPIYKEDGTTIN